ncbi:MAG: hypothetical protein FJX75_10480 [Armatimonadetes bacterium]|nr:hypothetical protein [Armatimonadota bacterium]
MGAPGYRSRSIEAKGPRSCLRGCVAALIAALLALLISYIGVCRYYEAKVDAKLQQLKAAGLPTCGADLQPPPVPEAENAAPLYIKAANSVEPKGGGAIKPPDAYNAKGLPTRADLEALAEFVGQFGEAAALVREATERPKCRFDTDWSDPPAALFPHLARMRVVARFTRAEATVESYQGEQAAAVDRLRMGFVAGRHVSGEACLITVLVGCAIDSIMFRAADYVMAERPVPPREARALAEELVRLDYGEWMGRAMRTERVFGISVFDHLRAGDYSILGTGPGRPRAMCWVHSRAFPVWRCHDELYYLGAMDELARVASLTPHERAADPAARARWIAPPPPWAIGSAIILPVFTRSFGKMDTTVARRGLLATALGVEVYRQHHHVYPARLADLQSLDWPVAKDVFSDADLVYRRSGSGFVLYSIGPDLTDDAGKPPSDIAKIADEKNVDIVWTATGR